MPKTLAVNQKNKTIKKKLLWDTMKHTEIRKNYL